MTPLDLPAARLIARASVAAYVHDDAMRAAILATMGLQEQGYFVGRDDSACLVAETMAGEVLWVPRGTEFTPETLPSIRANLETRAVDVGGGHHVMAGYERQTCYLLPRLRQAPEPDLIGGHSLGGCVANIMAQTVPWKKAPRLCITLGAPRHGDAAFNAEATIPRLRIERENDPAPRWPIELADVFEQPPGDWWLHDGTVMFCDHRPMLGALLFGWGDHAAVKYDGDLVALVSFHPSAPSRSVAKRS